MYESVKLRQRSKDLLGSIDWRLPMSAFHPFTTLAASVCVRPIADIRNVGNSRSMSHINLLGAQLTLFSAVALSIASPAAGAPQLETLTKNEVRSEEPRTTHRRLRDVVWNLFEQQDYRRENAPTRPLSNLFLRTKTQATRVPNLCRYDGVWVEFEKVNPRDDGPDAPMRAAGLTSSSYFTFLSPPTSSYEDAVRDGPGSDAQCAKLPDD